MNGTKHIARTGGSSMLRRLRYRAGASVIAALVLAPLVNLGAAEAATGSMIVVRHSGKCLDVAHASVVEGTEVVQGDCWGGNNQRWTLVASDYDSWNRIQYYNIKVTHSEQCLDVAGGSQASGASVVQWGCWNGRNQQWRRVALGYGRYTFVARHSGKCLEVADYSYEHAAPTVQATCTNGLNQQWTFRA